MTPDNPIVWRSRDQIIELYNTTKRSKVAKSLSATVERWVSDEARARGWKVVVFPLEYPSHTKKAGAAFQKKA